MYRSDVLVMPDDRFHPSDTWDKTYSKEHLAWKDAKQLKTFDQWAAIAKLKRTDDREADMKALDQLMSRYTFVREHRADDFITKLAPVDYVPLARNERYLLFVDEIMSHDRDKAKYLQKSLGYSLTGDTRFECMFFLYGETFFIGTEYPCHAEGLHPTTEGNFICNMNAAKRQRNN